MPQFYVGWLAPKEVIEDRPSKCDFDVALLTADLDIGREIVMVPCKAIVNANSADDAWDKVQLQFRARPLALLFKVACEPRHLDDFKYIRGLPGTQVRPT